MSDRESDLQRALDEADDERDRLRAIGAALLEALEWIDRRAGLGPHVHDRIRAAIALAKVKP